MNNVSKDDFDSFCRVIQETLALFEDLIDFEKKKMGAIAENDVALLDQYMKEEQAFLLRMRGLDQKREKLQEQMQLSALTFRQIIERFDDPEKSELNSLYQALSVRSSELKEAIKNTKAYINLHLSSISALLEKLEAGSGTYDQHGEKAAHMPPDRFTPTKA